MPKHIAKDGQKGKYIHVAGKRRRLIICDSIEPVPSGYAVDVRTGQLVPVDVDPNEGLCETCNQPMNEASDRHLSCGSAG